MEQNWQLARKRAVINQRARIIQQIRAFFIDRKFLEVETPHRIPANAPELHIDAIRSEDWFLQTSPELCMKRLLAAGYGNLFQVCRCWRANERSNRHLPEYSMLEWYRNDSDYLQLMDDCEQLLIFLCPERQLIWQDQRIDLSPPWQRITVAEAFSRYARLPLAEALANDRFDEELALRIEPSLPTDRPVFLTEYPIRHAALAKSKSSDPAVAERFELYVGGHELANAFSELTDPIEQRQRFEREEEQRSHQGKTPYPLPESFLKELANLSSAAGIALGIDRLIMLFCDVAKIDDAVCFTPEQLF